MTINPIIFKSHNPRDGVAPNGNSDITVIISSLERSSVNAPPIAIRLVEAKKAVPFCSAAVTWASTMRMSRASMRRSKALTYDRRGRIFVIYLLIVILTWVVKIVCQTPFYIILGLRTSRSPWLLNQTARLIQVGGTFLSASLIGALLTIAITLIYYDERVRREGLDLQLMMSAAESAHEAGARHRSLIGIIPKLPLRYSLIGQRGSLLESLSR